MRKIFILIFLFNIIFIFSSDTTTDEYLYQKIIGGYMIDAENWYLVIGSDLWFYSSELCNDPSSEFFNSFPIVHIADFNDPNLDWRKIHIRMENKECMGLSVCDMPGGMRVIFNSQDASGMLKRMQDANNKYKRQGE